MTIPIDTHNQEAAAALNPGAIVAGALLLGLGLAMFLDTTGVIDIRPGRLIGPLLLIALGANKLFERRAAGRVRRGGSTSGVWLIGIGVWMLAAQHDLFGLTFHNSWPLLIVLGGVIMVIRGFK